MDEILNQLKARSRRLMWLYSLGALASGSLKVLLVGLILQAILKARLAALSKTVLEFEALVPHELYPLPDYMEWEAIETVNGLVEGAPTPKLLTDEEEIDRLIDLAESVSDEELASAEDWLEVFKQELDDDSDLGLDLDDDSDLGLDLDDDSDLGLDLDDEEGTDMPVDDDMPPVSDDDLKDFLDPEEEARELAQERIDAEVERVESEIERITQGKATGETQKARIEALRVILKEGSPILPDHVAMVWETDAFPCPECLALAGTPVEGKRGHHPNCQCVPDVVPAWKSSGPMPGFDRLTIEQLELQLAAMEGIKDSEWKTKQTKRVEKRLQELRNDG